MCSVLEVRGLLINTMKKFLTSLIIASTQVGTSVEEFRVLLELVSSSLRFKR